MVSSREIPSVATEPRGFVAEIGVLISAKEFDSRAALCANGQAEEYNAQAGKQRSLHVASGEHSYQKELSNLIANILSAQCF
jgi:hypothetical protein